MNIISFLAKTDVADVVREDDKKRMDDSVILVSDDETDSVVYIGTSNAVDESLEKSNASGYDASSSASTSSDYPLASPPNQTQFLQMLYSGQGALIPVEWMRPPPRDKTSTQKKENDV